MHYQSHANKKRRRKAKSEAEEIFETELNVALKTHDMTAGPGLMAKLDAGEFVPNKRLCGQLLYLMSGGDSWERLLWQRHGSPRNAPLARAFITGKSLDVFRPRGRGADVRRTPGVNYDLGRRPEELVAEYEREMAANIATYQDAGGQGPGSSGAAAGEGQPSDLPLPPPPPAPETGGAVAVGGVQDGEVVVDFERDTNTGKVGLRVSAGVGGHLQVEEANVEAAPEGGKRLRLSMLLGQEYSGLLAGAGEHDGQSNPSGAEAVNAQHDATAGAAGSVEQQQDVDTGGGETAAQGGQSQLEAIDLDLVRRMYRYMVENRVAVDEAAFMFMARVAVVAGDLEAARRYVQQVLDSELELRMRTCIPCLQAYAYTADAAGLDSLVAIMRRHAFDFTENEVAWLIFAYHRTGEFAKLRHMLTLLNTNVGLVHEPCLRALAGFFQSEAAAKVFQPGGMLEGKGAAWSVKYVRVDSEGVSPEGVKLKKKLLSEELWTKFHDQVRTLLEKRRVSGVHDFTAFLDQQGPFDIIVDGANVAFNNSTQRQNKDVDFSVLQIKQILETLAYLHPDAKVLTILHISRQNAAANAAEARFLRELQASGQLYYAPKDANDDWFWLWGAVHGRESTYLLTNDLMRDHRHNMGLNTGFATLLHSQAFTSWAKSHVLRYGFKYDADKRRNVYAHVHYPLPYSHFTQAVDSNFWMVPVANQERGWLRIRPSNQSDASDSPAALEDHIRTALIENHERFEETAVKFVDASVPLPGARGPQIGAARSSGGAPATAGNPGAVVVKAGSTRGGQYKGARAAHVLVPSVDVYLPGTNVRGTGVQVTLPPGEPRAHNVQVPHELMSNDEGQLPSSYGESNADGNASLVRSTQLVSQRFRVYTPSQTQGQSMELQLPARFGGQSVVVTPPALRRARDGNGFEQANVNSAQWRTTGGNGMDESNRADDVVVGALPEAGDVGEGGDGRVWQVAYHVDGSHHSLEVTCQGGKPLKINVPKSYFGTTQTAARRAGDFANERDPLGFKRRRSLQEEHQLSVKGRLSESSVRDILSQSESNRRGAQPVQQQAAGLDQPGGESEQTEVTVLSDAPRQGGKRLWPLNRGSSDGGRKLRRSGSQVTGGDAAGTM